MSPVIKVVRWVKEIATDRSSSEWPLYLTLNLFAVLWSVLLNLKITGYENRVVKHFANLCMVSLNKVFCVGKKALHLISDGTKTFMAWLYCECIVKETTQTKKYKAGRKPGSFTVLYPTMLSLFFFRGTFLLSFFSLKRAPQTIHYFTFHALPK